MASNRQAFLDMLAYSEIGPQLLAISDNGYNILVGSTPELVLMFHDYSTHPNRLNRPLNSTAAGRYQIIHPTFLNLCAKHGFKDFTPPTQDAMALALIYDAGAMPDIDCGDLNSAIQKCANIWASLPGGNSGQHENSLVNLENAYTNAGGCLD